MFLKKLATYATVSLALTLPFSAHAINAESGMPWENESALQALSLKKYLNQDLETGSYLFGNFNHSGKGFFDSWSFSLAETSNVTLSLSDFNLSLPFLVPDSHGKGYQHDKKHQKLNDAIVTSLFDNKFLTASLFDEGGNLLGTIGENGLLTLSGLQADSWYTLTVSGKAAGLVGGLYYGSADVTPVPLGDTLPLFGSALVALTLVRRRRAKLALENSDAKS